MGIAILRIAAALGLVVVLASDVSADAKVDWQRGLLIASCAAPADLRAPNPDLARVKAERVAKKRCADVLRSAASQLPVVSGKSVERVLGEPLSEQDIATMMLDADQGSDGSVVVRMALGIDAVRALLYKADRPLKEAPALAPPLIIDARSLKVTPALGYAVGDGNTTYRGPTLFFLDEASARADTRVGEVASIITPKNVSAGTFVLDDAKLRAMQSTRSLLVILYSEAR